MVDITQNPRPQPPWVPGALERYLGTEQSAYNPGAGGMPGGAAPIITPTPPPVTSTLAYSPGAVHPPTPPNVALVNGALPDVATSAAQARWGAGSPGGGMSAPMAYTPGGQPGISVKEIQFADKNSPRIAAAANGGALYAPAGAPQTGEGPPMSVMRAGRMAQAGGGLSRLDIMRAAQLQDRSATVRAQHLLLSHATDPANWVMDPKGMYQLLREIAFPDAGKISTEQTMGQGGMPAAATPQDVGPSQEDQAAQAAYLGSIGVLR